MRLLLGSLVRSHRLCDHAACCIIPVNPAAHCTIPVNPAAQCIITLNPAAHCMNHLTLLLVACCINLVNPAAQVQNPGPTWSPAAEKVTAHTGADASRVCTDRLLRMSHS